MTPIKLTNFGNCHNGVHFHEGLVEDPLDWDPQPRCGPGGIFFCDQDDFLEWTNYTHEPMYWAWDVQVPDGTPVVHMATKSKAKRLRLSNCRRIWEDPVLCEIAVKKDAHNLGRVVHQTPHLCVAALRASARCALALLEPMPIAVLTRVLVGAGVRWTDVELTRFDIDPAMLRLLARAVFDDKIRCSISTWSGRARAKGMTGTLVLGGETAGPSLDDLDVQIGMRTPEGMLFTVALTSGRTISRKRVDPQNTKITVRDGSKTVASFVLQTQDETAAQLVRYVEWAGGQ